GTGRGLKGFRQDIQVIAVEPAEPMHGLEGLKHMPSSIVPPIYKETELDEKLSIATEDGWGFADRLVRGGGLLVGHSGGAVLLGPQGHRIWPLDNAYDRYHAKDPLQFPRTSRTAYRFDPRDWLRVTEEADARGEQVSCIFHSHGDVGAYFSAEDTAMAAPDG